MSGSDSIEKNKDEKFTNSAEPLPHPAGCWCWWFFTSCNHYYYAPAPGKLMGLSEQGDVKLSAGKESNRHYEQDRTRKYHSLQAGVSPVRSFGIQGELFSHRRQGLEFPK